MTSSAREARLVSRILRWGIVLAFAGQILWSLRPAPSEALTPQQLDGRVLFQTNCSTCHGLDLSGTTNGPTLQGAGPAAVDFMLSSGRMPLANPDDQPERQAPKFTPAQIAALVSYVQSAAPGGPAIPVVDPASGSLPAGQKVFSNSCSGCHGVTAVGDSVGGGEIAPSLTPPNATQIGEAIRIGPGEMPRFDPHDLSAADVNSIARYLTWIRSNGDPGGAPLGRVGPIAEGFAAGLVALGLLILVLRLTGSKT